MGVRKMIARLSELLRRTIDSRADDEVPLRDELAFVQRYIEIMEIRFQGRLRVEQNIAEETLEAVVPNLVLQPLVENALEHGAARAKGEARIEIAPGATHVFEEPGALARVALLARDWFLRHLGGP